MLQESLVLLTLPDLRQADWSAVCWHLLPPKASPWQSRASVEDETKLRRAPTADAYNPSATSE